MIFDRVIVIVRSKSSRSENFKCGKKSKKLGLIKLVLNLRKLSWIIMVEN